MHPNVATKARPLADCLRSGDGESPPLRPVCVCDKLMPSPALSKQPRQADVSSNPLQDPPGTNPYASPAPPAGSPATDNPLLVPAVYLLVLASLFLLLIFVAIPNQIGRIRDLDPSEQTSIRVGYILSITLMPLMNLVVVVGALSMIRLKGYRRAYAAAIFSVIPICSPCYLLGIPFGIWALILLNRQEVKHRFMA